MTLVNVNSNLICNNFASLSLTTLTKPKTHLKTHFSNSNHFSVLSKAPTFLKPFILNPQNFPFHKRLSLHICHSVINSEDSEDSEKDLVSENKESVGKDGRDWTSSILLFVLWGGLMFYVFNLAPNQTPTQDLYFLKKLLNLKGDDGYVMNQVLVSLWYIMSLWPLVYSMLLLPTGRSSKSNVPVWPFLILSFFGGAYALLPYFVLWKPPPPPVEEIELGRWPLNFLESKLTAGISLAAGLGLVLYAGLSGGDTWKEFYQYFRGSKFIHVMSIDFTLLSTFAPFWVYNDMTARKWYDKGTWLLPVSLVPLIGPALYLVLRPSLSDIPASASTASSDKSV